MDTKYNKANRAVEGHPHFYTKDGERKMRGVIPDPDNGQVYVISWKDGGVYLPLHDAVLLKNVPTKKGNPRKDLVLSGTFPDGASATLHKGWPFAPIPSADLQLLLEMGVPVQDVAAVTVTTGGAQPVTALPALHATPSGGLSQDDIAAIAAQVYALMSEAQAQAVNGTQG